MAEKKFAYRVMDFGNHDYIVGDGTANITAYLHPSDRCISPCGLVLKVWTSDVLAIKVNFYRFGVGVEAQDLRTAFIDTMTRVAMENDALSYDYNDGKPCYAIPTNSIGEHQRSYIGWTAFFRNADDAIAYYNEISAEMERIVAIIGEAAESFVRLTAARKIETTLHSGSVAKEYLALEKALRLGAARC